MTKAPDKTSPLSSELLAEVCSVIQDTGFKGSAEDYVKQFYDKTFAELTVCEAEMIVANLQDKKGCLFDTKEGGYER